MAGLASATVTAPGEAELRPRQLITPDGKVDERGLAELAAPPELLLRMYRGMQLVRIMDERLLTMQRQGRIGFYGEARGQEAAVIGTAAALEDSDYIVPALREAGAAIYRGLPLRSYVAQLFGNGNDVSKGRQMPCHPGTRASRYVTMSSCIATQLPHATGLGLAAKLRGDNIVVVGYLGDGATSEGDFHVALNFAGVWKVPVVFVCQNNQWAISTPVSGQTAAAAMACKALAYGMPALRVDGNDVLACYSGMRDAVAYARSGQGPILLEALTYRVSAHSSSDDPSRYRDESVTQRWRTERDPLVRYRKVLLDRGLLSEAADAALLEEIEAQVRSAVAAEESAPPPHLATLVEDVFARVPSSLKEQLAELTAAPRPSGHGH